MEATKVKLFYSYSHRDEEHREMLEKTLSLIRDKGILDDWHFRKIGAGEQWQEKIDKRLRDSDIIVLLMSHEFLASKPCKQEMKAALRLHRKGGVAIVPVILSPCGWHNTEINKMNALPADTKPVSRWEDSNDAWESVRVALTEKITEIRRQKKPILKSEFLEFLQKVEFVHDGKTNISLGQLYIPPRLIPVSHGNFLGTRADGYPNVVRFSNSRKMLVQGEDLSGKTAMGKHIYAKALEKGLFPLYIDGAAVLKTKADNIAEKMFQQQYDGNYKSYRELSPDSKIVIIDNVDFMRDKARNEVMRFAEKTARQIFCFVHNDNYALSLYKDKVLADFDCYRIDDYGYELRRKCITKWLDLKDKRGDLHEEDKDILYIENIFRHRVMPSYPYYIYSTLQAREALMPADLQMTQSAHCHHAIIVAQLIKSGVNSDNIDSYLNYLSELAYRMYTSDSTALTESEIYEFNGQYKQEYSFSDDDLKILHILSGGTYSILRKKQEGEEYAYSFHYDYAYYFFLGAYIAKDIRKNKKVVEDLRDTLYRRQSALVLLFTIHHTKDAAIIDDIVIQGLLHYDRCPEARLDEKETTFMMSLLGDIPEKITDGTKQAREERQKEDALRDQQEAQNQKEEEAVEELAETDEETKNLLMAIKTMEVLGQILRNHGGSLPKRVLSEIFESAQSLGLRTLNYFLRSLQGDDFLEALTARALKMSDKKESAEKIRARIKKHIDGFTFFTMSGLLHKTAHEISSDKCLEIAGYRANETPARLLVNYIIHLTADKNYRLDQKASGKLIDRFIDLSDIFSDNSYAKTLLRGLTVHYMNTHEVLPQHKQKLLSLVNKK